MTLRPPVYTRTDTLLPYRPLVRAGGEIEDTDHAAEIAKGIGYPVMMKASAGGGGKGMRLAYSEKDVRDTFQSVRNEAQASFGDDRVFIEKFVEGPRQIGRAHV